MSLRRVPGGFHPAVVVKGVNIELTHKVFLTGFLDAGLRLATIVFKSVCVSVRVRAEDRRQCGVNAAAECCVCGFPSQGLDQGIAAPLMTPHDAVGTYFCPPPDLE